MSSSPRAEKGRAGTSGRTDGRPAAPKKPVGGTEKRNVGGREAGRPQTTDEDDTERNVGG
jgi:hypothetical protein